MKILPSEPQTDSDFSLERTANMVQYCLYGTVCRRTDDGTSFGRKEGRHRRRPKQFENSPREEEQHNTLSHSDISNTHEQTQIFHRELPTELPSIQLDFTSFSSNRIHILSSPPLIQSTHTHSQW